MPRNLQHRTKTQTDIIMKDQEQAQMGQANVFIGQSIKRILKERGRTVVWFAECLGCSRTNVYKIFDKHSINTDELMKISLILNYDFFRLYSDELSKRTE